jgi:hypothetical protein
MWSTVPWVAAAMGMPRRSASDAPSLMTSGLLISQYS